MPGSYPLASVVLAENQTVGQSPTTPTVDTDYYVIPFTNNYVNLITHEYQDPKFEALVKLYTDAIAQNIATLNALPSLFDVDVAIGQQLDYTAQWIGETRNISPGIASAYFSWGVDGLGWGQGYWADAQTISATVTVLPDDVFRKLLYAKISLNYWQGSITQIYQTFDKIFPPSQGASVLVADNQDMTMTIDIIGPTNPLLNALINDGYFNIRPTGVELYISIVSSAVFSWGPETTYEKGWGTGIWAPLHN